LSIREAELTGLQSLYRNRYEELHKKRKKFENDALQEADQILDTVNKTIEGIIREIRESQAHSEVIKKSQRSIEILKKDIARKKEFDKIAPLSINDIQVGYNIKSKRLAIKGQVSKIFKEREEVEIEAKGIKVIVGIHDVEIIDQMVAVKNKKIDIPDEIPQIVNEIDLRGKLAEDAIIELEKYLDQAIYSDWHEIRVIHGKGTGALRKKIHTYLKKKMHIKSFRLGKVGEGDSGVTVIEI
jgi:DNA mismatch repair protein MutS2